ncbi:MAG TPA: CAP domain-containing protein [Chitinophagaceae bacterium]|nr:CAP domain-containing protein [Chitinophagaceae bacterium]
MKHLLTAALFFFPLFSIAQLKDVELEARTVPKPTTADTTIAGWNTRQSGLNKLTPQAQDFFYWTNYSRENPRRFWDSVVEPIIEAFPSLKSSYSESLKIDLYASPSLPLFKLNPNLIFTAESHAKDIGLKKGKPGHISTDGRTFVDRIKAVGIKNCGGENVSLGDVDPIMSLVLLYIDYGIPTLGHRKSLLNPDYVETGIGTSPYGDTDNLFIVEDFSCAQ